LLKLKGVKYKWTLKSFCLLADKTTRQTLKNNTSNQHDDFNTVDYKNTKNIYNGFVKPISSSFTGLFNAPVVPLHINNPH
jgi:hypothetical protein